MQFISILKLEKRIGFLFPTGIRYRISSELAELKINKKNKDNLLQLTYNNQPLYTYIFDRMIGDDKGDNVGMIWHYIEL